MNIQQIEQDEHEFSAQFANYERFASEMMTAADREREARMFENEDGGAFDEPEPTHEDDHRAGRVMDDRVCDMLGCPYAHADEIGF